MSDFKVNLVGDNLSFDVVDLLSCLSEEQEKQLIEQLSCSDSIIKHVSDQIINGLTDNGYSGFVGCGHEPSTPLDIAVRRVGELSGEIAKDEIEKLQRNVDRYKTLSDEYRDKYFVLYHKQNNPNYIS